MMFIRYDRSHITLLAHGSYFHFYLEIKFPNQKPNWPQNFPKTLSLLSDSSALLLPTVCFPHKTIAIPIRQFPFRTATNFNFIIRARFGQWSKESKAINHSYDKCAGDKKWTLQAAGWKGGREREMSHKRCWRNFHGWLAVRRSRLSPD